MIAGMPPVLESGHIAVHENKPRIVLAGFGH
jgi:hypothetical protein